MKVYVSNLNDYSYCPMRIYLTRVLGIRPEISDGAMMGLMGHFARRELSLRQCRLIKRIDGHDELRNSLLEELEGILRDMQFIYKNKLYNIDVYDYIQKLRRELQNEIQILSKKLCLMINDLGVEEATKRITPWRVEFFINSENLGISGRVDKIMKNPGIVPVEIKTGQVPEDVWLGDKLQICAYAMLLEDKLNSNGSIDHGLVEYVRMMEERPVLMTENLRRSVLRIRDAIIDILDGEVPERCNNDKKCNSCVYKSECFDI